MLEDVKPEGAAPSPKPGMYEAGQLAFELAATVPVVDGSIPPTPPLHPIGSECEPVEDEAASESSESNYAAPLEA